MWLTKFRLSFSVNDEYNYIYINPKKIISIQEYVKDKSVLILIPERSQEVLIEEPLKDTPLGNWSAE